MVRIQKTKRCIQCGKDFTPEGNWYQRNGQITCTVQCRSLYERQRVELVLGGNKPLIDVFEDRIVCNICGASLRAIGKHMQRIHLLDVGKSLSKSERQIIYGLTQGQRCATYKEIDFQRERAKRTGFAGLGVRIGKSILCPPHKVLAPKSLAQRTIYHHNLDLGTSIRAAHIAGEARKRRAATLFICPECGKEITITKSAAKNKRFCSRSCATRASNLRRDPEVYKQAAINISKARRANFPAAPELPDQPHSSLHSAPEPAS